MSRSWTSSARRWRSGAAGCSARAWSTRAATAAGIWPTSTPAPSSSPAAAGSAPGRSTPGARSCSRCWGPPCCGWASPAPAQAAGRRAGGEVEVLIPEPAGVQAEEDRSRRPTVFSALREVVAAMAGSDPHLGLYGAFGYDLAFQFEPVGLRHQRPGEQRDLVLHLPDEIYVLDRKRETATRYRYDFEVAGASTRGLPRRTPPAPVGAAAAGDHAAGPSRPGRNPVPTPASSRRPGSGSPAATCSRSSPATPSTRRALPPPPSTSGCGGATRPPTSSSSTSARGSAWSARRPRCTSG